MKLYISTVKGDLMFDLPKGVSKANLEQAIKNDINNQSMFLEIISNGVTYFINKHTIVECWIDGDESDS